MNLLTARSLSKVFGPTRALKGVDLELPAGQLLALVGGNGAGKSTLSKILAGILVPEGGEVVVQGVRVDPARWSPRAARGLGIRMVHQELSLCPNLTLAENFYLEFPRLFRGMGWRKRALALAQHSLEAVFPGFTLDDTLVGELPLAQQQMVEIARACTDPDLRLLILDEPTSAMDAERSTQLFAYLRGRVRQGAAVIFISHRLDEVLRIADTIVVLRDGQVVWRGQPEEVDREGLIQLISGADTQDAAPSPAAVRQSGPRLLDLQGFEGRAGEILGLSGLEGQGQREFLRQFLHSGRRVAFVPGDRQREGIFPLWSALENAAVSWSLGRGVVHPAVLGRYVQPWLPKLALPPRALGLDIRALSGGTQQKILLLRALLTQAEVLLLDDPLRGVDAAVKREFNALIQELAGEGKLILWYSSDIEELKICDRLLVFSGGKIVAEMRPAAGSQQLVRAAFQDLSQQRADPPTIRARLGQWGAFLAAGLVLAMIGLLTPGTLSSSGLGLLLVGTVPLLLASLGQMFVVGGSQIDLSLGSLAGFANVLSSTLFHDAPWMGGLALLALPLIYWGAGWLIEALRLPSLIITMGGYFLWLGLGFTLQPVPGGSAPEWLTAAFNRPVLGLPAGVFFCAALVLAAWGLNRSRSGVVLRGYGGNPLALAQAGWSTRRAAGRAFALAGLLGTLTGVALTAINTASDVSAATSYTLLSVAAVVMGGCSLVGGIIFPLAVAAGAFALSLIGVLLGFLNLNTDYTAAVQGGLLIGAVLLQTLFRR